MNNLAFIARTFVNSFEARHRDNGEAFHCLKDNSPQWIVDTMFAVHENGDLMPNDWSYRLAGNMADHIADSLESGEGELSDIVFNASCYCVPDYNHERLAWLASHSSRVDTLDELLEDWGRVQFGIIAAIGDAIRMEAERIGYTLINAFENQIED